MLQSTKKKIFIGLVKSQIRKSNLSNRDKANAELAINIIGNTNSPYELIQSICNEMRKREDLSDEAKEALIKIQSMQSNSKEEILEKAVDVFKVVYPQIPSEVIRDYAPMIMMFVEDEQTQPDDQVIQEKWF